MILQWIQLTMLCLWLGHKPMVLNTQFIGMDIKDGRQFPISVYYGLDKGTLKICKRCHFVYWSPTEDK